MEKPPCGFVVVDKPAGWTSFDVCAVLRRQLKIKRVGHTGTLDPFATGMLIAAVGKATKLIPYLEKATKTYEAEVLLGHDSETLDPESEVTDLGVDMKDLDQSEIQEILESQFTGAITQIPPKYSALKVDGQRMYDLARQGKEFEIEPRETFVHAIEVLDFAAPSVKIRLTVSAGFYVRSFARDLGVALGLEGGICQVLRRTMIGDRALLDFTALTDANIKESDDTCLLDPQQILNLPTLEMEVGRIDDFSNGRAFVVSAQLMEGEKYLMTCEGKSMGIGEATFGKIQPRVGL